MRVAAIYDIHGNLPALEAVLQEIVKPRNLQRRTCCPLSAEKTLAALAPGPRWGKSAAQTGHPTSSNREEPGWALPAFLLAETRGRVHNTLRKCRNRLRGCVSGVTVRRQRKMRMSLASHANVYNTCLRILRS